jgi:DNA-binding CsgD family transcriptional regulator
MDKYTKDGYEEKRQRAVVLIHQGKNPDEIAAELQVSARSVYKWVKGHLDLTDQGEVVALAAERLSMNREQRVREIVVKAEAFILTWLDAVQKHMEDEHANFKEVNVAARLAAEIAGVTGGSKAAIQVNNSIASYDQVLESGAYERGPRRADVELPGFEGGVS